jgi:hypothetical protein
LAFSLVIKITKDEFEAAVISGIKRSFQIPFLLAVIFILLSVCGDKYKILFLTVEYKENEKSDSHADCMLL